MTELLLAVFIGILLAVAVSSTLPRPQPPTIVYVQPVDVQAPPGSSGCLPLLIFAGVVFALIWLL